jgi:O-antigen ligase
MSLAERDGRAGGRYNGAMTRPQWLNPADPVAARRLILVSAALVVVALSAVGAFVNPLIGILGALTLLAVPLVLANRTVALALVVAVIMLLPFAALPVGIGFNPTLLDLALGAVYLIWIIRVVTRADRSAIGSPLAIGVLLFMGLAVVALVVGFSQGIPSKNQLRNFAELVLGAGLFIVLVDLVTDARSVRRVFLIITGFGCLAALVALGLYLLPATLQIRLLSTLRVLDYPTGPAVLRYLNDDPARLQRATGTSIDPNALGGMLAAACALLLPQLVSRVPLIRRRVAVGMVAIMGLALVATVSRGALVGVLVAGALVAFARDRRLLAVGIALAVVGLAVGAVVPWSRSYLDHFVQGLAGADRATQMRFGEYKDAFRLIQRYPLFGVGFGDVRDADLYRGVSSLYLIVASSMGVVGLAAFVGLLVAFAATLVRAWRGMSAAEGMRGVVLGSLAALTAVLVSGVFDHYFFTYPHEFALLWLVLGLGVCAARVGQVKKMEPDLPRVRPHLQGGGD